MIPHRVLRYEIFGNGLKDRVTACRKRCASAAPIRTQVLNAEEAPPAPTSDSEFPADSPAMRQLVDFGLSPVFTGAGEEGRDTLQLVGEHEVGKT